jgi:hypothetical protein
MSTEPKQLFFSFPRSAWECSPDAPRPSLDRKKDGTAQRVSSETANFSNKIGMNVHSDKK